MSEPFALSSPFARGADQRTRIVLFAMNLRLQPGEDLSIVTADAEDAAHRIYNLTVEHLAPVPSFEWTSAIVVRLSDDLGDVGDVLLRVSYRGVSSNRVRVGIGHVGGGPPDALDAVPTPARPYTISGQVRDDNQGLDGIQVTLVEETGTTLTDITRNGGSFSFADVPPGRAYSLSPSTTPLFSFNPQNIEALTGNRAMDFTARRRTYSISGAARTPAGNGIGPVTVSLSGDIAASITSDSSGNYAFAGVPAGRDYTVTVSTTPHYTFTQRSVSNLIGDQTVDFTGALRNYVVKGRVTLGPNNLPDFVVPVTGSQTSTATTDSNGEYSFVLPAAGDYLIRPSLPFHTFSPPVQIVTNLSSEQINRNFVATREIFSIGGKLMNQEGLALEGIAVSLGGQEARNTVTDSNGSYLFPNLQAGFAYTVTPATNSNYTFSAQSVDPLGENETVNFIGLRRFILGGRVLDVNGNGITGVTMDLTGSETATATTSGDGSFSILATATGNYFLSPSMAQDYYTFTPSNRAFNSLGSSQTSDFIATLAPFPNPPLVLDFDGSPKTVDYGLFWQEGINLGHFFWEFWAMPGQDAGATYLLSDGYGGAHALLFGFANLNTSEAGRYQLSGNIYNGITHLNNFGSDQGPAPGEWGHLAVGWDGQSIVTYYNGVPVGKSAFTGPRRTPGPGGGGGRLLIGGSDHSNLDGRIAQVRGYEDRNPREDAPGQVEASYAPETVFSVGGNLLSYYFRPAPRLIADLSQGYSGNTHTGFLRGTTTGVLNWCLTCPPPQFVSDPSAPNFATGTPSQPVHLLPPAPAPAGALVFDSFSRSNSTYAFGGLGGLGSSELGVEGAQLWQCGQNPGTPQPFGILNGRAVLLTNDADVAWVATRSSSGNLDVRVDRRPGLWGSGVHTGLSFRVMDSRNFFFAYTSDTTGTPSSRVLSVGYYLDGSRTDLVNGVTLPVTWTTLRVLTRNDGTIEVYADQTRVFSTNTNVMSTSTGAGIYNNSPGLGLVNRWDNFTVFNAP